MIYRTMAIIAALALGTLCASLAHGGQPAAETEAPQEDLTARLQAATSSLSAPEYLLVYKFTPGEVFRTEVSHTVTVETRIQGNTQKAESRSNSTKAWEITSVDDEGNIHLTLRIEDIDMWQSVTGREPVSYNSRTDDHAPLEYEEAAATVGEPLDSLVISPQGEVLERTRDEMAALGFGDVAVPLPQSYVKVGESWNSPGQFRVRLAEGQYQAIQLRQHFTLDSVEEGVAKITVRTEVLTPVDDPVVQSQLMQQLQHGEIEFDIEAGRVISKTLDLDEMVIGFKGANSMMKYIGHYREVSVAEPTGQAAAPAQGSPATSDRQASQPLAGEERVASLPEEITPPATEDDATGDSSASEGGSSSSEESSRTRRLLRRG